MNKYTKKDLKQGVDLVFTSKSHESDDGYVFNNVFGLVDAGSDYSDLL